MNKPTSARDEAEKVFSGLYTGSCNVDAITKALERAERRGRLDLARSMEAVFREWERCRDFGSSADQLVKRGFKDCADWCANTVAKLEKESESRNESGEGSK